MFRIKKSFFVCFVFLFCSFVRADESSINWSTLQFELITIQDQLNTLKEVITMLLQEQGELNYTVLPGLISGIQEQVNHLPEIKEKLQNISDSLGYSLGSDVFEIYNKVSNIDGNVYETYSKVSGLLDEVINIQYRLEELTGLSSHLQNMTTYLQYQYEADEETYKQLEEIIHEIKNLGLLVDLNEDLSEMAGDIYQIRHIFELNIDALMNHIAFIANRQDELYVKFTYPFSQSHLDYYSFDFDYAYNNKQTPESPDDWQIGTFSIFGGDSPNGILQDIGTALVCILEGDANASTMLATLCKNLSFQQVNEQEKKTEYTQQIEDPISDARSEFEKLWTVNENGEIEIDDSYSPPISRFNFKERFLSLFTEYQNVLRRYDISELPEGKLEMFKYTFGNFQVDSFDIDLPIQKFSFVFESIRIVFGVVYYIVFLGVLFFVIRWAYLSWKFITKYTTALSNT